MKRFCQKSLLFITLLFTVVEVNADAETKRIKLVILDNSGTTNDCGVYAPSVVMLKLFEKYGLPISMADAREPMGLYKKDHIRAILSLDHVSQSFRNINGRDWNESDVDKMYADFIPLQMSCLADYAELIPGLADTISAIRRDYGVLIGSTTGFNQEMNELLLSKAKEQGYFPDVFTSASQVPKARPYWYMVEDNMQQAGVLDPEEVLKIGDTRGDIQEGKAMKAVSSSGTWTVGLSATGNYLGKNWQELVDTPGDILQGELMIAESQLYEAGADYVVPNINSLPTVIKLINARLANGEKPRSVELDIEK